MYFLSLVSTSSATALTPDGTRTLNYIGFVAPIIKAVQQLAHAVTNFAEHIVTRRVDTQLLCVERYLYYR